jgi:hypothetical protein
MLRRNLIAGRKLAGMNLRQQLLSELMIERQRRSCIEHPDNLPPSCQVVKTTVSPAPATGATDGTP